VRKFLRFVALPAAIVAFACKMWAGVQGAGSSDIAAQDILNRYLQAEQTHVDALRDASMDVDIDASIPKLKEHGRLHALRRISKVGTVTYHAITFQGDNTIKHQVIARYLDAERQAQANQNLAITPANYKFKFKGERTTSTGDRVYVFEIIPRHRRIGLFKGDMWLDAKTDLPVYEKGRLVKSPSIFFKKVEFERAYSVETGLPVPVHTASLIKTRLVGEVELNVSYSNFELNHPRADAEEGAAEQDAGAVPSSAVQVGSGPYAPQE
jgi:hypothetical protein